MLQPQADPRAFFCAPTLPSLLVYQTDNTTQTFTPQWDWFALARIAQAATSSDAVKPALTMSWALLCVSSCAMCATACYLYCGTVGGIVKTPPYIYTRVPRGRLKIREDYFQTLEETSLKIKARPKFLGGSEGSSNP